MFVHALTFTVYKGQRTTYKNWLSPSFIPGNKMQIVRPGSKFLYVLSHPARLSGDFKPTLWLTLRVLYWANASVTTVCTGCCGGVKGQMTWGKALHALAGRFIFYSEGLSFGSTAKERKHEKVGFLYGFVLLLV